jgi:hypothetical protein
MIAVQARHPLADRQPVDRIQRHVALLDTKKMFFELLEVRRVIAVSVRADVPLVFEVLEELCDVGPQAASLRVLPTHGAPHNRMATL